MATYNYTNAAGGFPAHRQKVSVVEVLLDFASIAAARSAAGQAALAANDVLQLIPVKAGTWVQFVKAEVETAEGETATFDIGDGTDVDGYIDGQDGNALGVATSAATTAFSVAVGGGKHYTADDTIDILLLTAAYNVGKVRVWAVLHDLRSDGAQTL